MTLADRADAYIAAFPKREASWPRVVREQGRDVIYATWVVGADYRTKSRFYGAYPPGYLERLMAFFPDLATPKFGLRRQVLHAFSGSLPLGNYVRLDINPANHPDVVGSVYHAASLLRHPFRLVVADPPYSAADAEKYGTAPVDKRRAVAALADVTEPGGILAWLDTCWPLHTKRQWLTVGRILVQRSTNHRVRLLTLFERAN